jgi:hypothetical protein
LRDVAEVETKVAEEDPMRRPVVGGVAFAFLLTLGASDLGAQGIRAGVKAGGALSDISGVDNVDTRWGVAAGAYAGIGLGGLLIQPELMYVQRRAALDPTGPTPGDLDQDYVDVALLLGTSFGIIVKPMIYVAPVASFETSCGISTAVLQDECTSFDTKSAVLSGAVGAGLDIGVFSVDLRYTYGLSHFGDNTDGKWRTLTVMAGFGLSLGM